MVSAVSAWEIATKVRLGRLPAAADLVQDFVADLARQRIRILDVSADHGIRAGSLPGPHRDPFDRMLAAQAEIEGMPLVTADPAFRQFNVRTVW